MTITDEHFQHWLEHGYAVVENFFAGDELTAAQEQIERLMANDSGTNYFRWPFEEGDFLNQIPVHPDLVSFVERGIGTSDIACVKSELIGKMGDAGAWDEPLHCDFDNNMLVVPRDDDGFRQITTLTYFVGVDEGLGPTGVVSQQATHGLLPRVEITRAERPDLYDREIKVTCPAGSMLLYGMRTYHRGTGPSRDGAYRPSMWHVFQASDVPWRGPQCWDSFADTEHMARALTLMTPRQRELFGFPKVGHSYWNAETVAGVATRYPDMDMSVYVQNVTR
jgi:ectoine hydroxylase-related dioxygenase (phytanoyl-CoA dioxygenase family)